MSNGRITNLEFIQMFQENQISIEEILKQKNGTEGTDFIFKKLISLKDVHIVSKPDHFDIAEFHRDVSNIVIIHRLNYFPYLNSFLKAVNLKLPVGGNFIGIFEEYTARKKRLISPKLKPSNYIGNLGEILLNGVAQKFSKGKDRVLSKAEAFGRLYCCGFEIIDEKEINGEFYFVARKIKEPVLDKDVSYGPWIKLKRIGKGGKRIMVYKLRTMYPFSEYLQDYVFKRNELQDGGKFKNDFRISRKGKFYRKFWLDELPMIINLLKGEMKIVGVRPLSEQYFSLYTKELQEKRIKTKPGLLPPFYADMPKTLQEIIASELKYLKAYEKAPFKTDITYFWLAVKNILLRGARSK